MNPGTGEKSYPSSTSCVASFPKQQLQSKYDLTVGTDCTVFIMAILSNSDKFKLRCSYMVIKSFVMFSFENMG